MAGHDPAIFFAVGTPAKETGMKIALLIFDRMTALDAVGPLEIIGRAPGA